MKMKKACEATALTERAIRLYLKKNLISPRQMDGIIDFSNEDIQRLKDIALLRQFDFTIEQISSMIHEPSTIPDIILLRAENAHTDIEHKKDVHTILNDLDKDSFNSVHLVAAKIREHRLVPPEPDFGRFDEISDEVRQQERQDAMKDLSKIEKRAKLRNRLIAIGSVLTALVVLTVVFLSYPRVSGFISIAPFSVVEIGENNKVTIRINSEQAIEAIGRDTITVSYSPMAVWAMRLQFEEGSSFEPPCQLAVQLTNFDLIRMGINPFTSFNPRSVEIHNEWMKYILHSLFDSQLGEEVSLWIYEPCNLRPLFWQAE